MAQHAQRIKCKPNYRRNYVAYFMLSATLIFGAVRQIQGRTALSCKFYGTFRESITYSGDNSEFIQVTFKQFGTFTNKK